MRRLIFILAVLLLQFSCKREDRGFRVAPPNSDTVYTTQLSQLHAGTGSNYTPVVNEYEANAYAMSEGKRLFSYMNCSGCHSHGGGGMGPPLMDDQWIYGSNPDQVFATIVEGRPNGMPSFRGKIADYQVWQLVAYVRSMSGLTSKDAANGRGEESNVKPPENSTPTEPPKDSNFPAPQ